MKNENVECEKKKEKQSAGKVRVIEVYGSEGVADMKKLCQHMGLVAVITSEKRFECYDSEGSLKLIVKVKEKVRSSIRSGKY